jgi:hypothetical protein
MIVCPNCNHSNPDGAAQCEACYTPLPATTRCPNCGAPVQTDASFCGQCGSNLQPGGVGAEATFASEHPSVVPNPPHPEPPLHPEPSGAGAQSSGQDASSPDPMLVPPTAMATPSHPSNLEESSATPTPQPPSAPVTTSSRTQLQQQQARFLHVQTNTLLELPQNLSVIHVGKSNDRIPPDIDVSGFPNSEIVSRVHADIRVEGDAYYLEDVGSSNGTYVNNMPLPPGNRHRLRPGDRISLGKGDLVTLLFQLS